VDEVGTGRLGPVFRAHEAAVNRYVAVKLFTMAFERDGARRLLEQFEHIIAAELCHPSIVKPLAAGLWGSSVYLVQELVSGESLELSWRKTTPTPLVDALGIVTEIAGALDSAAVAHVRHGFLAPQDVLIHGNDTRVIGFGVAQALEAAGAAIPPPWADRAPRRSTGERCERQSDMAALGAIVERLLAPRRSASSADVELQGALRIANADVRTVLHRAIDSSHGTPFTSALEFVAALMTALGFEAASASAPAAADLRIDAERLDREPVDLPILLHIRSSPDEPATTESIAPTFSSARTPHAARPAVFGLLAAALAALVVAGTAQYRSRDSHSRAGAAAQMTRRATPPAIAESRARPPLESAVGTAGSSSNRSTAFASRAPASDSHASMRPVHPAGTAAQPPSAARSLPSPDDEASSMLFVDSQPRGATLYVDDKMMGTTPLAIPAVTAGEHALRLESDGRPAWSSPVRVRANHLNRVVVTLDR
jgi:serine/threonine protein kinase